jgi:microcin C transport system substrate-binding protein
LREFWGPDHQKAGFNPAFSVSRRRSTVPPCFLPVRHFLDLQLSASEVTMSNRLRSNSFARTAASAAAIWLLAAQPLLAQEWRTASSLIPSEETSGDFERYSYVNPDAPKGGTLNAVVPGGTFDSFNPFVVRGTAAAGFSQFGGILNETLMQQSLEAPGTSHPLLAEAFKYPDDYSSATYRLNPDARWHDGKPVTAEDVVWSFEVLKKNSPFYNRYYADVTEAVALNAGEVEFRFSQKGNRELPHIMGDLAVLPKHWWEGKDAQGQPRDVAQPTLEPPLGSGPYKIGAFRPGAEITWNRVEDYWGAALPVNVGRNNFAALKYVYIQDDNAAWLAFGKGGLQDVRRENSSRRWAQEYNFPAVQAGDVLKAEFPASAYQSMQGFALNLRRPQFQNRDVRHALTLAYDFETQNRQAFFGLNTRTNSFFLGSELASSGVPQGRELAILEPFRAQLPPELFTEPFTLPVYDSPQAERSHLREAVALFKKAGWEIRDRRLVNVQSGEQMRIEMLGSSPTDEIIAGPFLQNLRKLGIDATLRIVDATQYVNRMRAFDFDMTTEQLPQSQSPGNEQRDYWSSQAADIPGSRNTIGLKDPVVDALVDKVIFATDREDLVAATNALDRVLLWNYVVVPQYHRTKVWIAYWNKFGIPEKQPAYVGVDTDSWWIDPAKEQALAAKYRSVN